MAGKAIELLQEAIELSQRNKGKSNVLQEEAKRSLANAEAKVEVGYFLLSHAVPFFCLIQFLLVFLTAHVQ